MNSSNRAKLWTQHPFDQNTQQQVLELFKNPEELEDAFYRDLEFGTGGMRGIMGVGTNRVNKYTFGKNTQGICEFLKKSFAEEKIKVVIGYDCRHQSDSLAQLVSEVFSANGIQVFLFSSLRATPEVSFAVRELGCHCGVVLTASHNPPEYNGYKVYWKDGGQIVPPIDNQIVEIINRLQFEDILFTPNKDLIHPIDAEIDLAFQRESVKYGKIGNGKREDLTIVFTSLHGTSITAIPQVLEQAGYTNVHIVKEQAKPNGDFPTVNSPNPEEPEALKMALDLAEKINADIVIGTDPDADRLGIAVRNHKGKLILLNGNQTMAVMTRFILEKTKRNPNQSYFVGSTIVSTPMIQNIAQDYGVECKLGLTGFKWIAKMIEDFPNQICLGGGEESFGFMVGNFVRDKDAVTSTLLACEIASEAKSNGSSFFDQLMKAYIAHGLFLEQLTSFVKKGKKGAEEIQEIMAQFRSNPPQTLDGETITKIEDYKSGITKNMVSGIKNPIDLPKANVLIFQTEHGIRVAIRPSGTEPKIKFYISVQSTMKNPDEYHEIRPSLEAKIKRIAGDLGI